MRHILAVSLMCLFLTGCGAGIPNQIEFTLSGRPALGIDGSSTHQLVLAGGQQATTSVAAVQNNVPTPNQSVSNTEPIPAPTTTPSPDPSPAARFTLWVAADNTPTQEFYSNDPANFSTDVPFYNQQRLEEICAKAITGTKADTAALWVEVEKGGVTYGLWREANGSIGIVEFNPNMPWPGIMLKPIADQSISQTTASTVIQLLASLDNTKAGNLDRVMVSVNLFEDQWGWIDPIVIDDPVFPGEPPICVEPLPSPPPPPVCDPGFPVFKPEDPPIVIDDPVYEEPGWKPEPIDHILPIDIKPVDKPATSTSN